MRRLAFAALAGAAALACPATAAASHSNGSGPKEDFVTGSVRAPAVTPFGTFASEQHVNARAAGPEVPGFGAPARGWSWIRLDGPGQPLELRIRVTCINNVGNDSITRGVVVESNLPTVVAPGLGATARRVDNGEGQNSPPDEFFGMITGPPSGGADCPLVPFPTLPAEQGNVVVHDGG
jgi:hypothetical protein